FNTQRINSIRLHASEQKARHRYSFLVVHYFEWCTRGNLPQYFDLAQRVAALVFDFDVQRERALFMFTDQQTATFECCDVLCDSCARLHSKLSCDLCVGRYVTVAFEKAGDVIENLFLSLRSREHVVQQSR